MTKKDDSKWAESLWDEGGLFDEITTEVKGIVRRAVRAERVKRRRTETVLREIELMLSDEVPSRARLDDARGLIVRYFSEEADDGE